MNDMTIGQRIAEQRKKLGISQEALGEKMGVSRQAISKWESDSAVPEIDKLIGLSRLFGVSVGWLLGVEEEPAPEEDSLSETQIKMVEQIIKRYQPQQPDTRQFRWVFAIPIFAVSLAVLVWAFSYAAKRNSAETDTQQFQQYAQKYAEVVTDIASIQNQLDDLSDRLDAMTDTATTAGDLLRSFDFTLTPQNGGEKVLLAFSAVPVQRQGEQTATLTVYRDGKQVESLPCTWDGAAYRALPLLPAADGYSYILTLQDAGGTQYLQPLTHSAAEDLLTAMTPVPLYSADHVSHEIQDTEDGLQLRVWNYMVDIELPLLAYSHSDITLERFDAVLSLNGVEVGRDSAPDPEGLFREHSKGEYLYLNAPFTIACPFPQMQEGDTLVLYLELEFTGCPVCHIVLGKWDYRMIPIE